MRKLNDRPGSPMLYSATDFKRKRGFVILCRRPDNELRGCIECRPNNASKWSSTEVHVFTPYVRIDSRKRWIVQDRKEQQKYLTSLINQYKIKWPDGDFFISRVGSKKCPIKVDWNSYWIDSVRGKTKNASRMNLKFITK